MASSVRSSQDDSAPILNAESDSFAKVIESRGKGLFLVSPVDTNGSQVMAYMPPKFRNALWIRRGSFVIIRKFTCQDQQNGNDSIELLHVLTAEQIKELKRDGTWPSEYIDKFEEESCCSSSSSSEDSSDSNGNSSECEDSQ